MNLFDSHCHLNDEAYSEDIAEVLARAKTSGLTRILCLGYDIPSSKKAIELASKYDIVYAAVGFHPENLEGYTLEDIREIEKLAHSPKVIAIGEVGLDFYWSREFEREQLLAFEAQVKWSVETGLPLMIHCRKAQNELVAILRRYHDQLPGGVFHCFTGNALEAKELLQFERFVLGIGGVLTFKKSHLPEVLPEAVPLDRIVLETDAPYMAPVPMRGQRNEPAFVAHVLRRLAEAYGVAEEEVAAKTNANCQKILNINV